MYLDRGAVLFSGAEVWSMRPIQQQQDNPGRDEYVFSSGENPDLAL
jgi:hypothetical protein